MDEKEKQLLSLIKAGRLPISPSNVSMVSFEKEKKKEVICKYSADADLTIIGFSPDMLNDTSEFTDGYSDLGNILFVNANKAKAIN